MKQQKTPLSADLQQTLDLLRQAFSVSSDLVIREITVAGYAAAVVSIEGMIDRHMMTDAVLLPLSRMPSDYPTPDAVMHDVRTTVLGFVDMLEADTLERLSELLVSGFAAVLIDGVATAVLGGLQAFMIRSVSEPSTEVGVRGSREGFTEAIRINISMIRRRLKTPRLTFEMLTVGQESQTAVCLCYMRGRVSQTLLDEVRTRITNCPLDIVLESGYLQPFVEGERRSLFTGVDTTERPDTLCGKVAEGRIGVLVDGTPFALVVPFLFAEHFQSMDDYTQHPVYASFIRLIKYVAFAVSLFLPGLYVAIGTHHADMLPAELLLSFINSARSTPFPLTLEALLIHFLFEVMREAGLRFPKSVGHAVSIVGALVIGESVVRAGLVSAPMVIIVALTSISAFVIPSLYGSIAVLRFVFIVLGGSLGLYGVTLGALLLLCSLSSLDIVSIPITAPV
ncbi:MAG: spore germination protein, partial [Clostridia bacterium]|nr:spore germination protein [Clostridia bacterium]